MYFLSCNGVRLLVAWSGTNVQEVKKCFLECDPCVLRGQQRLATVFITHDGFVPSDRRVHVFGVVLLRKCVGKCRPVACSIVSCYRSALSRDVLCFSVQDELWSIGW